MRIPASFSIRAKLIVTVMITTCTALGVAGAALSYYQSRSHREAVTQDLATVADIVGQNLPAALLFEKADSAEKALEALASLPDVLSACLYDGEGHLFSHYIRSGHRVHCPKTLSPDEAGFRGSQLVLHHPVRVSGQPPGNLRIVASLGRLEERIRVFGLVLLVVLSTAALVALGLSSGLQRLLSRPILDLASTAQRVSQSHDYTLRAPKRTHDEVGVAVEAFNQMLSRIEQAVSERKRAEEALLALNTTLEQRVAERTAAAEQKAAELERSNEELERFASVASHDLQEPLRAVRSYTQLIEQRVASQLDPETTVYFNHVQEAAGRMRDLINDLLNYARVGRQTLSLSRVDCARVLEEALADLAPTLKENQALVIRRDLPVLIADAGRLAQVFRNLITNAVRFRSKEPPRMEVSAERVGDMWSFAVRDNGIGIEPRHHDRIFVIFQRLHGRERPGTGIGLAICRKIVEMHGGRIWVESELGKGATFRFTLPASVRG